jgi:hypothetical protein
MRNHRTSTRRTSASPLSLALCLSASLLSGAAAAQEWTTSGTNIYNANTGNVGIGTAAPGQKFTLGAGNVLLPNANGAIDGNLYFGGGQGQVGMRLFGGLVNGTIRAGFIDVMTTDPADGLRIRVDGVSGGTERMRITANGFVGINTTAPVWPLHVAGGLLSDGPMLSRGFPANDTTADITSRMELLNRGAGGTSYLWRIYTAAVGGGFGVNPNSFEVWEYPPSGQPACCIPRLRILKAGATVPGEVVIDGAGNLTVAGNIAAKYQDLAEWVKGHGALSAGTVVVLDQDRSDEVLPSDRPYDTRVAGVVSAAPGIVLGEPGEGKVKISTTGRVKVKVDAASGPIQIGDLLVTSGRVGYAMKSRPISIGEALFHRPGTLIGKALEPLAEGEGEILVLLSLQ